MYWTEVVWCEVCPSSVSSKLCEFFLTVERPGRSGGLEEPADDAVCLPATWKCLLSTDFSTWQYFLSTDFPHGNIFYQQIFPPGNIFYQRIFHLGIFFINIFFRLGIFLSKNFSTWTHIFALPIIIQPSPFHSIVCVNTTATKIMTRYTERSHSR